MTAYRSSFLLGLAALSFSATPQDSPRPEPLSLAAFRDAERARLEREIEGAWTLFSFASDLGEVDPRDVRGFATFHAGFMTLILQGREEVPRLLRGPGPEYTLQAGAFRYRLGENLALQTASVLGYSNANAAHALEFEAPNAVREYEVQLVRDELVLGRAPGVRFTFRRTPAGEFPSAAIEALDRARAGFVDPSAGNR